jgi:hypothetical protein
MNLTTHVARILAQPARSRRSAVLVAAGVLAFAGCSEAHTPPIPTDAGADAPLADAAFEADAPDASMSEALATFELPSSGFVSDAVATLDGEVCIAGVANAAWSTFPDAAANDAFVACFDVTGPTRARRWPCTAWSWGASRIAAHPNGDLFVVLDGACQGLDASERVERLDRALTTRATATLSTTGFGPDLRDIATDDGFVVVSGSLRMPGRIGERDVHGPLVVVLTLDDLEIVHVVGNVPAETASIDDASVAYVAVEGANALFFGRDVVGGAFAPEGGPFVRSMRLPNGDVEPSGADGFWHHQYGAAWHPDGRPVVFGTQGAQTLRIGLGDAVLSLDTGYGGAPHFAFRGEELLIARPFFERITLAGRTFTNAGFGGGFLLGVDAATLDPRWARQLQPGYRDYLVEVTPDGLIGVVGRDPVDASEPSTHLAFYR